MGVLSTLGEPQVGGLRDRFPSVGALSTCGSFACSEISIYWGASFFFEEYRRGAGAHYPGWLYGLCAEKPPGVVLLLDWIYAVWVSLGRHFRPRGVSGNTP